MGKLVLGVLLVFALFSPPALAEGKRINPSISSKKASKAEGPRQRPSQRAVNNGNSQQDRVRRQLPNKPRIADNRPKFDSPGPAKATRPSKPNMADPQHQVRTGGGKSAPSVSVSGGSRTQPPDGVSSGFSRQGNLSAGQTLPEGSQQRSGGLRIGSVRDSDMRKIEQQCREEGTTAGNMPTCMRKTCLFGEAYGLYAKETCSSL